MRIARRERRVQPSKKFTLRLPEGRNLLKTLKWHRNCPSDSVCGKGRPGVTFIPSIPLAVLIVLIASSGDAFDGVTPVPEPGTLGLLAVGFGALGAIKILRGSGLRLFAGRSPVSSSSEPPAEKENLE